MDYLEKRIKFNDDEIIAFLEKKSNNIFVGVSYICNNLGMTKGQKDRQVYKVQVDETLKTGIKKLRLGIEAQVREQIFIKLDYIHLWLAKINPNKFNVKLRNKLLNYQLYVKDVLFDEFFGKRKTVQEKIRYNIDLNLIDDRIETIRKLEEEKRQINLKLAYLYTRINYTSKSMIEEIKREYKKSLESKIKVGGKELTTEEVDALDTLVISRLKDELEN